MTSEHRGQLSAGGERSHVGSGAIARASATFGLGTALSRITGLGRVGALVYALGGTRVADTYNLANSTPNIVYELILGGVLTATLVPVFISSRASGNLSSASGGLGSPDTQASRDNSAESEEAETAVSSVAIVALGVLAIIGVLAAPLIVRLYTLQISGPDRGDQQAVASELLRWFMPQMFFYGLTAIITARLHSRRLYGASAVVSVLNNLVVIGVLMMVPRMRSGDLTLAAIRGDHAFIALLGLGTTAGVAAMAIGLLVPLRSAGASLAFRPNWRHPAVRKVARLSVWTLGYVASNQIALWIILVLANKNAGDISAYQYAFIFFQLPHGLFAVSVMTAVGPELARHSAARDYAAMRHQFRLGVRTMAMVVIPASLVYLALARPIVETLLQHGLFTAESSVRTADVLSAFAIGLFPFSVYLFSMRAFYAMHDTRTPFFINIGENTLNIVGAVILYPIYGALGLAIAFSAAYGLAAVAALWVLRTRLTNATKSNPPNFTDSFASAGP